MRYLRHSTDFLFVARPNVAKRWTLAPWVRSSVSPVSVHFTFDDGPDRIHTPAVLERLMTWGISATFYLLGRNIAGNETLLCSMKNAGQSFGNHTYSHPRFGVFDSAINELESCQDAITHAVGVKPLVARPPFGRVTPGYWIAAKRLGLQIWNWSLDSGDWKCRSLADAKACAGEVRSAARPGDVILFHDNHRWIVPILEELLPSLAAKT